MEGNPNINPNVAKMFDMLKNMNLNGNNNSNQNNTNGNINNNDNNINNINMMQMQYMMMMNNGMFSGLNTNPTQNMANMNENRVI